MKMLVPIAAMIFLALSPASSDAQEKTLVGIIYGDAARTTEGISLDLLGIRFAIEDLNRKGGLLGKQIELVELQNNEAPIGSKTAAEVAVQAGVIAVVGPASSSHAILAGKVLQEAGIPMISTFATNPDVTLIGDYIFRVCFSDRFQGQMLADFAIHDLKAKTAVVLTCMDEKYSLDLAKFFTTAYRKKGGIMMWQGEFLNSATDFRELLEKAASYHPAVIFLPGYNRTSGFIIRQSRNMGQTNTFLGGDAWTYSLHEYGGDAINGCYYSGHMYPDAENQSSRDFLQRYESYFKREEIVSFGFSHDAVFLLADAVERAGSLEPALIRDALASTKDFQGLTGTITMDRNGDPLKPISFFRFEGENSVLIKTVRP